MVFFGKKSSGFSLWDFLYRHVGTIGIIILGALAFFGYMYLTAVNEDKKIKRYKKLSKRDRDSMKARKPYDYKKNRDTTKSYLTDDATNDTKIRAHYDSEKGDTYSDDEYDTLERHHRRKLHDDKRHHHGYEARHRRHMYDSD